MTARWRLAAFSVSGCIAYTLAYYLDWPLLSYDLERHSVGLFGSAEPGGPSIMLYGWIATAVLIAAAVALLLPARAGRQIPPDLLWLAPLASVLAAILYELRWFI